MSIENVTGYNATQYNLLLEQAQSHGVSSAKVEEAMLQAIQEGKDFSAALKHVANALPDLAEPKTSAAVNPDDWVALPSPAALLAGVITQDAAEQRRINRSLIQSQGMQIVGLMEQQADKMEKGAMQKFACAVAGAVVNMAAGAASMGLAATGVGRSDSGKLNFRAGSNADAQLTAAVAQSMNTMISSAGSIITSGGEYAEGLRNAEAKRLEAQQEQIRTMMEQTKQTNDAMKDLVSKSLDFMNAMQANMNQTRTKILG
ncbi:hypothetical protein [uncultured Desulfovibrio sp.]|uniref:hypothetical protein n=1 Tax=uncultured Desulfovibrio sp. TaxID=167968 RepID=UPI002617AC39|nr:hypothetical protein [uncultured Desulfovibrio sp.]